MSASNKKRKRGGKEPEVRKRGKPEDEEGVTSNLSDKRDDVLPCLWYRHTGQPEIKDIPYQPPTEPQDEGAIARDVGEYYITHLYIGNGVIPHLAGIAPQLTHLKIVGITDRSQLHHLNSLSQLKVLDLSDNDFSNGLPAAIAQLTSLETLTLVKCKLTDLPQSLNSLNQLKVLDLSYNDFSSGLPAVIAQLTSLERLSLQMCQLSDLPQSLNSLNQLKVLDLSWNDFSNGLPAAIVQLTSLETLTLIDCNLTDLPQSINSLKQLKKLNLSYNYFSNGMPAAIVQLTSLEALSLMECKLTDLPQSLNSLNQLKVLNLSYNDFSNGLPAAIAQLTSLETLTLHRCKLTDLPQSRDLQTLMMYMSDSDSDVSDLEEMILEELVADERDARQILEEAQAKGKFSLGDKSNDWCIKNCRFSKDDIRLLCKCLRLPDEYKLDNGSIVDGLEALVILLFRLAYPSRLSHLVPVFARSESVLSRVIAHTLDDLHTRYHDLLETLNQHYLDFQQLANLVGNVGPLKNCIGFIDGTVRPICKPLYHQRIVYNGHKRVHSLKFQAVMLPTGIIGTLHGPYEGRRHDAHLLRESQIMDQMQQLPLMNNELRYCIYGDPAYPLLRQLIAPYKTVRITAEEEAFNRRMSSIRQSVEYGFGKIETYWSFCDFKKNLKLYLQPVGKIFLVAALLTNCHTCLYGANVNALFDSSPPALEEYLRYEEVQ